jgi:aminodeoxyfutalosine deaminase
VEVARIAAQHKTEGVVGFGMGGDELAFPFDHFSPAFDLAAEQGLRRTVHAGEIGEPTAVLLAIEPLRAERVGHGIAALRDPGVTEWLTSWHIPLELCPTSNLRTGALARQLGKETATAQEHPLRVFFERGLRVVLSTDDPAMFGTTLLDEYNLCQQVGMTLEQTVNLAEMSFAEAFLPDDEKTVYLAQFQSRKQQLGLTE